MDDNAQAHLEKMRKNSHTGMKIAYFILFHPISLYFITFLFRFDEGQKVERAGGCPASSDLLLTSSIVQFVSPNLVSAAEDQNEDGG